MLDRRWSWAVFAAIGLYFVFGFLLIAQKPGLQYDEALLAAGGVHLNHSHDVIPLSHDDHTWVCRLGYCLPLMAEVRYVGAIKEYVCWPLFALFGPHAWLIRFVSLAFGAVGIWGVAKFIGEQTSHLAGVAVAWVLAFHPAYINMTTFDNGSVGAMMAGLGLLCAALAFYLKRPGVAAAFWVGAAAGFGVWTRANFLWMLAAGAAAALLVFGRRVLIPMKQWIAIVAGGIVGGLPFLLYQVASRGGTWEAVGMFSSPRPMRELLPERLFLLADTLLSDREHRVMWSTPETSVWQLWLFPIMVGIGCAACLANRRGWSVARLAALAFLFLAALLFSSRLQVAEHHLIALIPLAAVIVVLALATLQFQRAWILTATLGIVYVGCSVYWEVAAVQGLKSTGGVGVWSDAVLDVAKQLDQRYSGRPVTIVDWGLQENLYVLMDARLKSEEIYWDAKTEPTGHPPRPWMDLIRDGGVFLVHGTEDRQFPAAQEQFLRTLDAARPVVHRYTSTQRNGATYAQIIEIEPNSIRGSAPQDNSVSSEVSMSDPNTETQLIGFYKLEDGGWRWTKPQFSVLLNVPDTGSQMTVALQVFVPEISIKTLGALTISGRVGGHNLAPLTYTTAGANSYKRDLPADAIAPGVDRFEFEVDKHLGPTPGDARELGIVVTGISLEAK